MMSPERLEIGMAKLIPKDAYARDPAGKVVAEGSGTFNVPAK